MLEGAVGHDDIAHAHLGPHAAGQPREHDLVHAELADQRNRGGGRRHLPHARQHQHHRLPVERASVVVPHADGAHGSARVFVPHGGDQSIDFVVERGKDAEGHGCPDWMRKAPAYRRRERGGSRAPRFQNPLIGTGRPLCYSALAFAFHRFPSHASPGEFRWNLCCHRFQIDALPSRRWPTGAPRIALTRRASRPRGPAPCRRGPTGTAGSSGRCCCSAPRCSALASSSSSRSTGTRCTSSPSSGCWRVC
ncbi:hypothetical protein D3C81_1506670 [compost metagenome]